MPYKSTFLRPGAVTGLVGDAETALHYGDSLLETRALREGVGVVDLAWRGVVEITGRDRVRFLNGMCTNDVKALKPGQGCMAAVVNRQGKMVAEIVVRAAENALLLEVDRSNLQATIEALRKYVVADDVVFTASEAAVAGVYGPGTEALLQPGLLAEFAMVRRGDVMISLTRELGVDGYHLLVPASRPDEVGRILAHGGMPVGFEAWESLRILNGFPRWGVDMGPDVLPMEAGLEPIAISYTKGCYIGQEVIQRVKTYSEPPRMLVSLELTGLAVPAPGAAISAGGQEVGHVTSAATGRALGYVRKEQKADGTAVTIAPGLSAVVRALPWHGRR